MPTMSKQAKGGRPAPRRPTKTVFVRLAAELAEAVEAYLASLRPRPTLTGLVGVALEEFLERRGCWPRPQEKGGGQ